MEVANLQQQFERKMTKCSPSCFFFSTTTTQSPACLEIWLLCTWTPPIWSIPPSLSNISLDMKPAASLLVMPDGLMRLPENVSHTQGLHGWWDDVNDSKRWQDGLFYALCAEYTLVAAVALIQLIRIEVRVPEYGWTTQKVFHLTNLIVNTVRALIFGLHRNVFSFKPRIFESVFLDLPGLLFFSTYSLLVLFWAEIYHQARSLSTQNLRPAFLSINGVIYVLQICVWIYEWISPNHVIQAIAKCFFAVISFIAAVGFLVYGGRLFLMLRRFPIESKGRRKKLREVGFVATICFTCFIVRCIVVAVSAFDPIVNLDVMYHPVLNLLYYTLVEVLPSAIVLYILRRLPKKRGSCQYYPIQ